MTIAPAEITLDQVITMARRLSPADQARLVEKLAPVLVQALTNDTPKPRASMWGILADLGPGPSAEEIDEARREAWANFPREDLWFEQSLILTPSSGISI